MNEETPLTKQKVIDIYFSYIRKTKRTRSASSKRNYINCIKKFIKWYEENVNEKVFVITKGVFNSFQKFMYKSNLSESYVVLINIHMKILDDAMVDAKVYNENRFFKIRFKNVNQGKPVYTPLPETIFMVRKYYKDSSFQTNQYTRNPVNIAESICSFELAVSSGMRNIELKTILWSDIDFKDIPYDSIEDCKSKYCGGSAVVLGKGSKIRKIYFSAAARRWLIILAKIKGKSTKDKENIFTSRHKNVIPQRLMDFGTSLTISNDLENSINEMVKSKERATESGLSQTQKDEIEKYFYKMNDFKNSFKSHRTYVFDSGRLTPHSLRRFATCLLYFRSYFGGKKNVTEVANLLGHESTDMTKNRYLVSLSIFNEDSWKKIMLGTNNDWIYNIQLIKEKMA